jgi:hypothetical protein
MTHLPESFGAYFWGGYQALGANSSLAPGLSKLQDAGFIRTARIFIGPRLRNPGRENVYNFDLQQWERECPKDAPFLGAAVRSTYYQRAFALPSLQTIVLTAYDSESQGPMGWADYMLQPDFLAKPENAKSIRDEYRDMTVALYETQRGTGKRFIVCNWETDNSIYFVGAWGYLTNPEKREECNAHPIRPAQRIEGFVRWFRLRKQGIQAGRRIAAARGFTGVQVNDAIEFNSFKGLESAGYPSTLYDVIPRVSPDYASFSSWESCNDGRLDEDLHKLKEQLGSTQLVVGEFGYEGQAREEDSPIGWRFVQAARAIARAQLPVAIAWEGYRPDYYGLLNADGSERAIMKDLRQGLHDYPQAESGIKIRGINDRELDRGRPAFELYGTFPGTVPTQPGQGYEVLVDREGQEITAYVGYESPGEEQINIIVDPSTIGRWCAFRVRRKLDNFTSLEFGPRLIRAI